MGAVSQYDSPAGGFRRYLAGHREQLVELLKMWDEDGDSHISAKEFRTGWRVLELDAGLGETVPADDVNALYAEMDLDGTGNIAIQDLSEALKYAAVGFDEKPEPQEAGPSTLQPSAPSTPPPVSTPSPLQKRPKPSPLSTDGGGGAPRTLPKVGSVSLPNSPRKPMMGGPMAQTFSPPKRTNLPRLTLRRPQSPGAVSNASSILDLSPLEVAMRRDRKERELTEKLVKHLRPGRNVPGPGWYALPSTTSGVSRAAVWAKDETPQHEIYDRDGHPVPVTKTHVGDPGQYVSNIHRVGQARQGDLSRLTSSGFSSNLPQRPIVRPVMMACHMWNGK